jgi:hypothetical protein
LESDSALFEEFHFVSRLDSGIGQIDLHEFQHGLRGIAPRGWRVRRQALRARNDPTARGQEGGSHLGRLC